MVSPSFIGELVKGSTARTLIAEGAGDVIATAVYALANDMTVAQMAEMWCPYLTMAEGIKLAAQTDVHPGRVQAVLLRGLTSGTKP